MDERLYNPLGMKDKKIPCLDLSILPRSCSLSRGAFKCCESSRPMLKKGAFVLQSLQPMDLTTRLRSVNSSNDNFLNQRSRKTSTGKVESKAQKNVKHLIFFGPTEGSNQGLKKATLPTLITSAGLRNTIPTLQNKRKPFTKPASKERITLSCVFKEKHCTDNVILNASAFSNDDILCASRESKWNNLTMEEKKEIQEYIPNVYFTGSKHCKKVTLCRDDPLLKRKSQVTFSESYDDSNGFYLIRSGDHLAYRYEIVRQIGHGTFGVVVSARDHKTNEMVAVKLSKSKFVKQAQQECDILKALNKADPSNECHIVRLLNCFNFRGHIAMVLELLRTNLFTYHKHNGLRGMIFQCIYMYAEQILKALQFLAKQHVIHCDIKPENIALSKTKVNGVYGLKLIDFGCACYSGRTAYTYVQSRFYRSPEVVLGIPYTSAVDMWSFGCLLCDMANGSSIFPAQSEGELLERMAEYLGEIPMHIVSQGLHYRKFFSESYQMLPNLSKTHRKYEGPWGRSLCRFLSTRYCKDDPLFFDLVCKCFEYDPQKRITPEAAFHHPWMQKWRLHQEEVVEGCEKL